MSYTNPYFVAKNTPAPSATPSATPPPSNPYFVAKATPAPSATPDPKLAASFERTRSGAMENLGKVGDAAKYLGTEALYGVGDVLGTANAVLGSPQRYVSGLVGAHRGGQHGFLGDVGSGFYEVLHPSEQQQGDLQGEAAIGMDKWWTSLDKQKGNAPVPLTVMAGTAPVTITKTADEWKQLGRDTIYENVTDPLNLLFGAGFVERKLNQLGLGVVTRATRAATEAMGRPIAAAGRAVMSHPRMQPILNFVRTAHQMKQETTRTGRAAVEQTAGILDAARGHFEAADNAIVDQAKPLDELWYQAVDQRNEEVTRAEQAAEQAKASLPADAADLEKLHEEIDKATADEIANIDKRTQARWQVQARQAVPSVFNRLNEYAYVAGHPKAARQALALGMKPSELGAAEKAVRGLSGPLNLIPNVQGFERTAGPASELTSSYFPKTIIPMQEAEKETAIAGQRSFVQHKPKMGYAKHQGATIPSTPPSVRLAQYFDDIRRDIFGKRVALRKAVAAQIGSTANRGLARLEEAAARETDPVRKARLEAVVEASRQKQTAAETRYGKMVRPGVESKPLTEQGIEPFQQAMSREQAFRLAQRELGFTPAALKALEMSPRTPFTENARLLATDKIARYLEGRARGEYGMKIAQSVIDRLSAVAPEIAKGVEERMSREGQVIAAKGAETIDKTLTAGEQGIEKARSVADEPRQTPEEAASSMQQVSSQTAGLEKQVGGLLGSAARTAGDVTKPLLQKGVPASEEALAVGKAGQAGVERAEKITAGAEPVAPAVRGATREVAQTVRQQDDAINRLVQNTQNLASDASAPAIAGRAFIADRLERLAKFSGKTSTRISKAAARGARSIRNVTNPFMQKTEGVRQKIQHMEAYNRALQSVMDRSDEILMNARDISVPPSVAQEVFGKQVVYEKFGGLRSIADLSRQAQFAWPIRHGLINVPTLQWLGPAGFSGVLRGLAIYTGAMGKPAYDAAVERLALKMGALAEYVGGEKRVAEVRKPLPGGKEELTTEERSGQVRFPSPVQKIIDAAKTQTQKQDIGQRIALMEYFDRDHATKDLDDLTKGGLINDTLINYRTQSPMSQFERGVGAKFPHWRNTVVARIAKAFVEHPERLNMLFRTARLANQDVIDPQLGLTESLDTPAEEGMRPFTGVFPAINYIDGTIGFIANTIREVQRWQDEKAPVTQIGQEMASNALRSFAPGGSLPEETLLPAFASDQQIPVGLRAANAIAGSYATLDKSAWSKIRDEYLKSGMTPQEADRAMKQVVRQFYQPK